MFRIIFQLKLRGLLYSFISVLFSASYVFASEGIVYYGDLNSNSNHELMRQELAGAIALENLPMLASFGKDQAYPPGYYYWRYVVDITNREASFLSLKNQYHQKNFYGFTVFVRNIESYSIGHALIGRNHQGQVVLQADNFDLKSFNLFSEVNRYADQVASMFQKSFWTEFYNYVAQTQPLLADELNQKRSQLREMLLVHAITIQADEESDISYRVSKYYNIIGNE